MSSPSLSPIKTIVDDVQQSQSSSASAVGSPNGCEVQESTPNPCSSPILNTEATLLQTNGDLVSSTGTAGASATNAHDVVSSHPAKKKPTVVLPCLTREIATALELKASVSDRVGKSFLTCLGELMTDEEGNAVLLETMELDFIASQKIIFKFMKDTVKALKESKQSRSQAQAVFATHLVPAFLDGDQCF